MNEPTQPESKVSRQRRRDIETLESIKNLPDTLAVPVAVDPVTVPPCGLAPKDPATAPPPEPPPPPPHALPAEPEAPPSTPGNEPLLGDTGFRRHDVVQIIDTDHRHFGLCFMVGDVLNGKVHGYHVAEGRNTQYVTVSIAGVVSIRDHGGQPKIRSARPCSPKWISDTR